MSYFDIFILALALSIDACVVSFSYGLIFDKERLKNEALLSLFTGLFQGLMPLIGYFLTNVVKTYIQPFAGVIVFLIFGWLGIKFIFEAIKTQEEKPLCISIKCLFLIGVATSIDAFSAGITLSLFGNNILKPSLLIALITFVNSNIGFWLGGKLKHLPSKYLEIGAGILLICLGIKSLM